MARTRKPAPITLSEVDELKRELAAQQQAVLNVTALYETAKQERDIARGHATIYRHALAACAEGDPAFAISLLLRACPS